MHPHGSYVIFLGLPIRVHIYEADGVLSVGITGVSKESVCAAV